MALQLELDRPGRVGEIADRGVVDLAPLAAHQHPLGTDPRKVLVFGEVVDAQPAVEVERGDDLAGRHDPLVARRTRSIRAGDDGRLEPLRPDRHRPEPVAQEAADQVDAMVAMGGRDLGLADRPKAS